MYYFAQFNFNSLCYLMYLIIYFICIEQFGVESSSRENGAKMEQFRVLRKQIGRNNVKKTKTPLNGGARALHGVTMVL